MRRMRVACGTTQSRMTSSPSKIKHLAIAQCPVRRCVRLVVSSNRIAGQRFWVRWGPDMRDERSARVGTTRGTDAFLNPDRSGHTDDHRLDAHSLPTVPSRRPDLSSAW